MPATDLFGPLCRLGFMPDVFGGAASGYGPVDPLTGIPIFAVNFNGAHVRPPGNQTWCPIGLTTADLCYIWYKAKHWTLATPSTNDTISQADQIFNNVNNPFVKDPQSMFALLHFFILNDNNVPTCALQLNIGDQSILPTTEFLLTDGSLYYPLLTYVDNGLDFASLDAADFTPGTFVVGGTFFLKNLAGQTMGSCDILTNGTPPYGDVIMQVDAEW